MLRSTEKTFIQNRGTAMTWRAGVWASWIGLDKKPFPIKGVDAARMTASIEGSFARKPVAKEAGNSSDK